MNSINSHCGNPSNRYQDAPQDSIQKKNSGIKDSVAAQGGKNIENFMGRAAQALTTTLAAATAKFSTNLSLPSDEANSEEQCNAAAFNIGKLTPDDTFIDMQALTGLLINTRQLMRETDRMEVTQQRQAEVRYTMNSAEQMEKSARETFKSNVITGSFQIASGAAQIGLSSVALQKSIGASQAVSKSPEQLSLKAESNAFSSYSQASGNLLSGIGGIASAGSTMNAKLADAQASRFDSQAKMADMASRDALERTQQQMETINQIIGNTKATQQSTDDSKRTITKNLA